MIEPEQSRRELAADLRRLAGQYATVPGRTMQALAERLRALATKVETRIR